MIKLFSDGADMKGIIESAKNPNIKGFTTNPTLMKQAGVTDYLAFAEEVVSILSVERPDTCISLEVFADDYDNMLRQAKILSNIGNAFNYPVYVKIPVTYTNGNPTLLLIHKLLTENIKVNVTAVFTQDQAIPIINLAQNYSVPIIISVFAGRIADCGINPSIILDPIVKYKNTYYNEHIEILWASTREILSYKEASFKGCDIITMTPDMINKMEQLNKKSLIEYTRETVKMFYDDSVKAGFVL